MSYLFAVIPQEHHVCKPKHMLQHCVIVPGRVVRQRGLVTIDECLSVIDLQTQDNPAALESGILDDPGRTEMELLAVAEGYRHVLVKRRQT
jgi:hypothetical protein